MSNKISKSDQDPHQTDRDAEGLAMLWSKRSSHFVPGTDIMLNNRRGRVLGRFERDSLNHLAILWEDGTLESITPRALN